jgi:hypothetical protein
VEKMNFSCVDDSFRNVILAQNGIYRRKRQKQTKVFGKDDDFSENGCMGEKNESVCGKN